jgi:spore maturation protein CgeB
VRNAWNFSITATQISYMSRALSTQRNGTILPTFGNYSPHKEKWLRPIVRELPGVRLRIVGSGWEYAQDDDLKRCAIGHPLTGDFCARAMQYSRINVGVHGEPSRREGLHDFVSLRTFEIPACKGFMLHIDNDEIRQLFEPGREIDVFANEDELIAKVTHYLASLNLEPPPENLWAS